MTWRGGVATAARLGARRRGLRAAAAVGTAWVTMPRGVMQPRTPVAIGMDGHTPGLSVLVACYDVASRRPLTLSLPSFPPFLAFLALLWLTALALGKDQPHLLPFLLRTPAHAPGESPRLARLGSAAFYVLTSFRESNGKVHLAAPPSAR